MWPSKCLVSNPEPGADTPASSPAPSSSVSASAGVQNVVVSPSVRQELTAAYEAFMGIEARGIAGTAPNSVYYAFDAATGTYWAMATFQPSAAALHSSPGSRLYNVLVVTQDGGKHRQCSPGLRTLPGRSRTLACHRSAR
jgi:hypothetical protein